MWLGFALFLVVVIVAMVVFISSLTGGSEPYTSNNEIIRLSNSDLNEYTLSSNFNRIFFDKLIYVV